MSRATPMDTDTRVENYERQTGRLTARQATRAVKKNRHMAIRQIPDIAPGTCPVCGVRGDDPCETRDEGVLAEWHPEREVAG